MFGNILDLVASIYTVTLCRLNRIFGGLRFEYMTLFIGAHQYCSLVRTKSIDVESSMMGDTILEKI